MIYNINSTYLPTQGVIEWCKEQHISYQLNQHIEGMVLLALSMLCMLAAYGLFSFGERLSKEQEISEESIVRGIKILQITAFIFTVGYIVYFVMLIK